MELFSVEFYAIITLLGVVTFLYFLFNHIISSKYYTLVRFISKDNDSSGFYCLSFKRSFTKFERRKFENKLDKLGYHFPVYFYFTDYSELNSFVKSNNYRYYLEVH